MIYHFFIFDISFYIYRITKFYIFTGPKKKEYFINSVLKIKERFFKNTNKTKVNKKKIMCSKSMTLKKAKKNKILIEGKKSQSHKKLIYKDMKLINKKN